MGKGPPKISSKVDVWSVGVIFYQCLYGRKVALITSRDLSYLCVHVKKQKQNKYGIPSGCNRIINCMATKVSLSSLTNDGQPKRAHHQ